MSTEVNGATDYCGIRTKWCVVMSHSFVELTMEMASTRDPVVDQWCPTTGFRLRTPIQRPNTLRKHQCVSSNIVTINNSHTKLMEPLFRAYWLQHTTSATNLFNYSHCSYYNKLNTCYDSKMKVTSNVFGK